MADTPSTVAITGPGGPISILAETDGSSNFALQSIPRVNAAPVSTTNPMAVTDTTVPALLPPATAAALALGSPSDVAWAGTGSSSVIAALKGIWLKLSGRTRTPYIGVVATRCVVPSDIFTDPAGVGGPIMSRTYHYATDNITVLQVGYAAWAPQVGNTDALPTHDLTLQGSVEFPVGVMHQLTWGGNATATVTPGQTLFSDPLAVTIPYGAKFFLRRRTNGASWSIVNTTNAPFTLPFGFMSQVIADDANGDAVNYGTADQTMSGTVTVSDTTSFCPPCAVIATTTQPSVALIGDSITGGYKDAVQPNEGICGIVQRAVSKLCGSINLGTNADTILGFITGTNATRRLGLAAYCSHVVTQYGINDLLAGNSAAQIEANLASLWAMFTGKPVIQTTITPDTTSTDNWATTANQTPFAASAARIAVNTFIRTVPAPLNGVFDVCHTFESSLNSGLWAAPGVTVDGVHPTGAGYELISQSGDINPTQFV